MPALLNKRWVIADPIPTDIGTELTPSVTDAAEYLLNSVKAK
jgi:hypothetical protein